MSGFFDGSLTGNILFGLPYGGFAVVDAVMAAILLFLALKIASAFRGKAKSDDIVGGPGPDGRHRGDGQAVRGGGRNEGPPSGHASGFPTDMARQGAAGDSTVQPPGQPTHNPAPSGVFDKESFLRGAKILFARLQSAWDKRDVNDIATFTTPAILNEVRAQADVDSAPSTTHIILINADLVSHERDAHEDVATVFFDVLLRESPDSPRTTEVKEIWHFVRPAGSLEPWKLDGIQPVS